MDPELLALFEAEMMSNLEEFERVLLAMEGEPDRPEQANEAFRVAHNLKGGAGLMEMEVLGGLAHTAEELLEDVRAGVTSLDVPAITVLLDVADVCRALIQGETPALAEEAQRVSKSLVKHRARLREAAGTAAPPPPKAALASAPTPAPVAPSAPPEPEPSELDLAFEPPPSAPPLAAVRAELSAPPAAPAAPVAPPAPGAPKLTRQPRVPRNSLPSSSGAAGDAAGASGDDQEGEPAGALTSPRAPSLSSAPAPSRAPSFTPAPTSPVPAPFEVPPPTLSASHISVPPPPSYVPGPIAPPPSFAPAPVAPVASSKGEPPQKPGAGGGAGGGGAKKPAGGEAHQADRTETIRVRVDLLEELINYVGELVVARNRLLQLDDRTDPVREENTARIDELTSSLHALVMKTRMQPIQTAWSVMTRLVRDVALQLGKKVDLHMKGGDTELDRNILANLHDPITHMVRNAVSHGIELPEERLAAGKPETGSVSLVAYHGAGQVHIEVKDDGRGLSRQRIADKAARVGLAAPAELAAMTDAQVFDFIFRPGFSTAEVVDSISGRGVGLDVVRSRIEAMGGSIDVETRFGEGMTFRMRLPLTLAIMPCLIVAANTAEYCIPQPNLLQILDLEAEGGRAAISSIAGVHFYDLDGWQIPLVRLGALLHDDDPNRPPRGYAVVVAAGKMRFGVVVDDVLNTEEMVMKPLGLGLEGAEFFSGTTVRGDGKVMLILDLDGIGRAEVAEHATASAPEEAGQESALPERVLLLCDVTAEQRIAVDVDHVISVRAVVDSNVRVHGGERVVDYMGRPVSVSALVPSAEPPEELVIVRLHDRVVALPVLQTLDVVRCAVELSQDIGPRWSEGITFINDVPTSVVDFNVLAQLFAQRH